MASAYTTGEMLLGLVLVGLAACSWGTTGAAMTLLAREGTSSPLLVGWARMAGAAPCLLLTTAILRPKAPVAGPWGFRDTALTALLGGAMAAYQVCYFWAVPRTGVALTALLAICSAPLIIALGAALFLRERLSAPARVALLLAVAGTALLLAGPRSLDRLPDGFVLGSLSALGAGLSYAVYALTAKGLLARAAPLPLAAATFTLATVLLTPVLLLERDVVGQLTAGWPLLLYLGLVPTAVAYLLFSAGLKRVPATAAGIATLLEPLTASILGVLAFGERLGTWGWLGAALLAIALVLLTRDRANNAPGGTGRIPRRPH
jgi:DME family drug/metabolite transporter